MHAASSTPKTYRVEIIIFVVALLVRVLFVLATGMEQRPVDALNDQNIFWEMSGHFMDGKGFYISKQFFTANPGPTSFQAPGYILFVAAVRSLFGADNFVAVRLVQAVISAVTCVVAYRIGVWTVGLRPALVAAAILCVYLLLVMYVRPILAETVFTFTLAMAFLWTYRLLDKLGVVNAIVAAAFWGITFLIRPEAGLYGVAIGIYALYIFWRDHRKKFLWGLHYTIPGIITFALVLAPWVVHNYQLHGEFVPATSLAGMNLWESSHLRYYRDAEPDRYPAGVLPEEIDIPNFAQLTEMERDRAFMALSTAFIRQHPDRFVYYGLTRVYETYPIIPLGGEFTPPVFPREDGYPNDALDERPVYNELTSAIRVWSFRFLFVCALIGILLVIRARNAAAISLVILLAFNLLGAFLFKGQERSRIFIDPYIILLSAVFLVAVYDRFRASRKAS